MSTSEYLTPAEYVRPYRLHEIVYDDPFVSDADTFEEINGRLAALSDMGYYGISSVDLTRKRKSAIDRDNPATAALIEQLPSFSDWLDLVPTAAALDSLYAPDKATLANGKPMTPELADWFRNITDGRGIRSRAHIVSEVMKQQALERDGQTSWLSLASGIAQPMLHNARAVYDETGVVPDITLVDADRSALGLARRYAEEVGIGSEAVRTKMMNILRPEGIAAQPQRSLFRQLAPAALQQAVERNKLPAESYDVVEVVGLVEYLKQEDWKYTYNGVIKTKRPMAGAETFLKNAYELVKPGGTLVVGNMLDTHPQLGFTLNVIQWPHIQPRSIDSMMHIMDEANVTGETDVYVPDDGAYAIYTVRKDEG